MGDYEIKPRIYGTFIKKIKCVHIINRLQKLARIFMLKDSL